MSGADKTSEGLETRSSLSGQVFDSLGQPIGACEVQALELTREGSTKRLGATRTTAAGRFDLPSGKAGTLLEVSVGREKHRRWVSPRASVGEVRWTLEPAHGPEDREARRLGSEIQGAVVDSTGRPVADAVVDVLHFDFMAMESEPVPFLGLEGVPLLETVSDQDGRFALNVDRRIELPSLDLGAFAVRCRRPGWAVGTAAIRREPEQSVSCRLSQPAIGAGGRLSWRGPEKPDLGNMVVKVVANRTPTPVFLDAPVDEAGLFETPWVLPDGASYSAVFDHPDYQPQAAPIPRNVLSQIHLELVKGVDTRVELVDGETGQAISEAEVTAILEIPPFRLRRAATTISSGFLLRSLPPGQEAILSIEAEGYLRHDTKKVLESLERIPLAPGTAFGVEVVDRQGNPVEGAEVTFSLAPSEVRMDRFAGLLPSHFDSTDRQGRTRIDHLAKGQPYSLTIHSRGFSPYWEDGLVSRQRQTDLRIVLDRGGRISGSLLYEDGTPLEGGRVIALRVEPSEDDPTHLMATPQAQKSAISGEDGSYSLEALSAGTYHFLLKTPQESVGSKGDFTNMPLVPLAEGDWVTDFDFFFRSQGSLRLSLPPSSRGSKNPEGMVVALFWDPSRLEPFFGQRYLVEPELSEDGLFAEIPSVSEGVYDIEVRHVGKVPQRFSEVGVYPGVETLIDLQELDEGRAANVQVIDSLGQALAEVDLAFYEVGPYAIGGEPEGRVTGVPEDSPSLVLKVTDEEGRASFSGLREGRYQVYAETHEGGLKVKEFKVPSGLADDLDWQIRMPDVFPVEVHAQTAGARLPLSNVTIALDRELPHFVGLEHSTVTNGDGRGLLKGVEAGRYTARMSLGRDYLEQQHLVSSPSYETTVVVTPGEPLFLQMP
ncbi:MAG: carboxypeptidase-like regulatory domain-containing protein [Deltaproteobacteria bacterium]|nr:carboxypeptidase-like regulatory domain-containing protein [Deltaproteobacteria bacterium]